MDPESRRSKPSQGSAPESLLQRIIYRAPMQYTRPSGVIPFHIPHRQLKAKYEAKEEVLEPLIGFGESQNKRRIGTKSEDLEEEVVKDTPQTTGYGDFSTFQVKEKQLPEICDQMSVINKMKNTPGFLYMIYSVARSSEYYTPYAFKIVPFEEIDRDFFLTISKDGVTQYYPDEMVFTSLPTWEEEYEKYCRVVQIKSYSIFRMWKGFFVWKKFIKWNKFSKAKTAINENLFILNPFMRKALLDMQSMICKLRNMAFTDMSKIENFALFEFIEVQMGKMESVAETLLEFRQLVKEIVDNACHGALLVVGYTVDDSNFLPLELYNVPKNPRETREKMSYTDQGCKKRFCVRLACFIHLVDFMQEHLLHMLSYHSLQEMHDVIHLHFSCVPKEELLSQEITDSIIDEKRSPDVPKLPLFMMDLVVEGKTLVLDPEEQVFLNIFNQLLDLWDENLLAVKPFLQDTFFNPFTEPVINFKQEERVCEGGTNLSQLLAVDQTLIELREHIILYIKQNISAVMTYIKRFNTIHNNYINNEATEDSVIENETDVEKFRRMLTVYSQQEEEIKSVIDIQPLGLYLLRLERFIETTLPSPRRLITVVEQSVPKVGRKTIVLLMEDATNMQNYLQSELVETLQFVEYLDYLENATRLIDKMENSLEYCKDIYDMIEEFEICVSPDEVSDYIAFSVTLSLLHNLLETKLGDRTSIITKFGDHLNSDIADLIAELEELKGQVLQPWLIDAASNPEEVKKVLNMMDDHLAECVNRADEFRGYQRQFKLGVTRYDVLNETLNEVRIRQLLWDTNKEWNEYIEKWTESEFSTLDPEEMQEITSKTVKGVHQLEMSLPENQIVPKLKSSVDLMKSKLPVITILLNPALKQRHWALIEEALNYTFSPEEPVTLKLLESVGILKIQDKIQEISGQASSEAALEVLLRKVEDVWKVTEFTILPFRDSKDVFTLVAVEEIQAILDDSNININTIISSRFIGPIKARVEEWVQNLDLFGRILEEWTTCQQGWMYLEPIFSAPDIQRQLPNEAKMFLVVDKSFKDIMRKAAKNPLAMPLAISKGLLETFITCNNLLEQIMKCLEAYLESKRVIFPRFYFLSNDELIEILAQARNPHAVQPHLRKCFDAIARLEFGTADAEEETDENLEAQKKGPQLTSDIVAMISPEGEKVNLGKGLKARGNVEDWLGKVEDSMFVSLRKRMKMAIGDYKLHKQEVWVVSHPSQIVLTVSQIIWSYNIHMIFDFPVDQIKVKVREFEEKCFAELNVLASMVRGDLNKLNRMVICSLITIDVHARDIVSTLVKEEITSSQNFEWVKQLRYYWDEDIDNCIARMSSAFYIYGYEYLGASPRLVITPLTDKCYLCLMGALQLDLGGAPAGPAGTGKTETTKDLAKSLAIQCVVFNCSEGLDYKMMGRFFSGLAQSGAWCCFDEFNRIDIEVLSVIAQQLITIKNAKQARVQRFMFEGREIKLDRQCAAFITMNPGYAGRTELPDNLKALFRPISMMVPDYALIAEVILYSEGFESSKGLANKMVQMYKLCSEQLSQQDHYDFGMRAVKSVLVMAGSLKRENPDKSEDIVLIRALRDSNLPKFLVDDAELFQGILNDLFPGVIIPFQDYGQLQVAIETVLEEKKLQKVPALITKVIQFHETMIVRHGVMLVGPTGGGKTVVLTALKDALTYLHVKEVPGPYYRPVTTYVLNPKSVTLGELYGEVNPYTMEWRDGLLGIMVRKAVQCVEEVHQWVVCDGPVDAVWIENMNTVLDDNKMLCLANSERIKLTNWVHMVFEVQDLAQASPATVSRCGMVYIDSQVVGWMPYVETWLQKSNIPLEDKYLIYIYELFDHHVHDGFSFTNASCTETLKQVGISKVTTLCALMESILKSTGPIEPDAEEVRIKCFLAQSFAFSYLWGLGGNLEDPCQETFELFIRQQFMEHPDARLPSGGNLWNLFMNVKFRRLDIWEKIVPVFKYSSSTPYFDLLVPTVDTVRFGYVMERLLEVNQPVLFTGHTGVGKSVVAKVVLNSLASEGTYLPVALNFSAQTNSARTQEIFESKLEKRKKTHLRAPAGKKVIFFVDDVNMPKLDRYGSQPPIELLRQYLDFHGLYDREKMFWKTIENVVVAAACAPPGGGRNPLTPRFTRHFTMLLISSPSDSAMKNIFKAIVGGFLEDFVPAVQELGEPIVEAAVEIYCRIAAELLPTPAKSHYVFNLRDLSKCIQGVLQANCEQMQEPSTMLRLFYHECLRVFHDRLINAEDKTYFYFLMNDVCTNVFHDPIIKLPYEKVITNPPMLLFGDFMSFGAAKENRIYDEITDMQRLKDMLHYYLEDYNASTPREMHLIFFLDAIEHSLRVARILRSERGNALLVGVAGMGKQSLTRIGSHLCGYKCFQIELTRSYDHNSFLDDLRVLYFTAGAKNLDMVFLITDTQITTEEFLEDINNILNSGEVPSLFEGEDFEKVVTAVRPSAKSAGIPEANRDALYDFFISRVRKNLHVVMCMSPVGDAFRRRCRMFPSLVNCCTIDWFLPWPQEALYSVAVKDLKGLDQEEMIDPIAEMCVIMHTSVDKMTVRFYEEMRRHYYTTPSSYIELLKLYLVMLQKNKEKNSKMKTRIANGLMKLYETNEVVDSMKAELTALEPELNRKSEAAAELMKHIIKEKASADKVRQNVMADEAVVKVKAEETQQLADEAQKDLDAAMPAMHAALKALEALNKNDINELKVFQKPPQLVRFVMETVCLLLGAKTDWASAKVVLADTNFLKKLHEFDKDNISESTLRKLKDYIQHPDFVPDIVAVQSKVCRSICMWVRAIDTYAKVYKVVQPKRVKLNEAEAVLNSVMAVLKEKQQQLAEVEKQIVALEASYDASIADQKELQDVIDLTAARLNRAGRLTMALGDEQTRWENTIKSLDDDLVCVLGDVLLAAGSVAYLGAFTNIYREELVQNWQKIIHELKIPTSQSFSLIKVLADPYEIRVWNLFGLPRDNISTENAILVTRAGRWPLMIDPQEQANRWIRNMESENQLKILKLTDSNFMRHLELAVRTGMPVMLHELGEALDPTLDSLLKKQTFVQAGRLLIHLGDSDVDYDENFRLYLTTKLPNPHYLPEVCILVTIVNFTVTRSGLEDQLLSDVVRLERPDLEKLRNELITRINNDKNQLVLIEDKILRLLFASEGNILDDEELIETLNESKETSSVITVRLEEAEATEKKITVAREKYRIVATRGSVLYFVVAQLADIDPMYQYSLKYFGQIFNTVIDSTERVPDLEQRLEILLDAITLAVYTNVSRGLFEKHKLVFSFMLCVDILKQAGVIQDSKWNYLLRGPVTTTKLTTKKPDLPLMSELMWLSVNYLEEAFASFKGIIKDSVYEITVSVGNFVQVINVNPMNTTQSSKNWNESLDTFDKLLLLKSLREEKLLFAITQYVIEQLGQSFTESPQTSLHLLFQDTSNVTPLIFVLTTGSDPFGAFQRFALEKGYSEKYQSISLGQGQGPIAEGLINTAVSQGDWVFLQNCHLATSWMLSMEKIIMDLAESAQKVHIDFRLFLSSMPSKAFPVSVLQNSVKVTNEPPKGLRANVKRAFLELADDFFDIHPLQGNWRKMIFGICFFHAVIQERKKFGPLGWNITYEFNDSDRECALSNLKMFCTEGYIPWNALEYITGEITYGGRVTDYWDLRCLKTILTGYFAPHTLTPGYKYSESGIYHCPEAPHCNNLLRYRDFIDSLPLIEEPEIFGMHENANIAFQSKETQAVVVTIMEIQPRQSSGSEGKSSDDIVLELSNNMMQQLPRAIKVNEILPELLVPDDKGRLPSLTTVLLQEKDRFNKLLNVIDSSLTNLQRAIKGFVVMSESLEQVYTAFLNNQVPEIWGAVSYPSLKSLGSWVRDLLMRLDLITAWLTNGAPTSFWISGLFFPQGFLTGTLQTHARKYDLPIDQLIFHFDVQDIVLDQEVIYTQHKKSGGIENPDNYGNLKQPIDGVLVHGLFIDAACWNFQERILSDPNPGELNPSLPVLLMTPTTDTSYKGLCYVTPLYKTSVRAGVLSTTGHSTNFVIAVILPSLQKPSYWILKGTALLTQLTD